VVSGGVGGEGVSGSGSGAPPPPSPAAVDEAAVAQLAAMGFSRARAVRALELAGGSADRAADLLMDGAA
jgi:hypothetical protein